MQTNAKTARPGAERKCPDRKPKKQAPAKKAGPQTAQQTIPYREIFKDGICRVNDRLYTKSMEYEDINYQLAQADDQSAIFDGYCAFLNSFDSSLPFQLSFINHRSRPESKYKLNIPMKEDGYSDMRSEYVEMLEGQIAKSNNGIVRTKLLTFGVSFTDNVGDIKLAEVFSNKKVKEWVLIFYIVGVSVLVLKESIKI